MNEWTEAEKQAVREALLSREFQMIIGAEEWDLAEETEEHLWDAIRKLESEK